MGAWRGGGAGGVVRAPPCRKAVASGRVSGDRPDDLGGLRSGCGRRGGAGGHRARSEGRTDGGAEGGSSADELGLQHGGDLLVGPKVLVVYLSRTEGRRAWCWPVTQEKTPQPPTHDADITDATDAAPAHQGAAHTQVPRIPASCVRSESVITRSGARASRSTGPLGPMLFHRASGPYALPPRRKQRAW